MVSGLDPSLALYDVKTMTEHLGVSTFQYRVATTLLLVFAALSLVLSSLGLYGLISFGVGSRRKEMALRAAIGASRRDVVRLVVVEGMKLTFAGMALGLAGAFVVRAVAARFLPSAVGSGLWPFAVAAFVLFLVALAASVVPATRASRVDPAAAFRVA